ncbi:MAG: hypothetical protein RLY21_331 [Planctomycetota bacterium]|jgi:hypothetical protein
MRSTTLTLIVAASLAPNSHADTTVVTFNKGNAQGWFGPNGNDGFGGATTIVPSDGNPTWNMRTVFQDFGIPYINASNPAFLGDFTTSQSVTLKIDLRVENLKFFGTNVSRPWLVELRNSSLATGGYPWVSVWYKFAQISTATHGQWTTFSITFDPRATQLPPGWRGTGAEDPVTYAPVLPAGVTFRDVLEGVNSIAFTTLEPGMFFGFTDHTFRIDNITVTRVPASVPGDLDGDGGVGAPDLSILLSAWGPCASGQPCPADLNGDGSVGPQDLAVLLAAWS